MNLNKIKNAIIIVLFLFLVTFSISWFLEKDQDVIGEKIIVLPLEGTITSGGSTDLFGGSSLSSLTFAEKIREINSKEICLITYKRLEKNGRKDSLVRKNSCVRTGRSISACTSSIAPIRNDRTMRMRHV